MNFPLFWLRSTLMLLSSCSMLPKCFTWLTQGRGTPSSKMGRTFSLSLTCLEKIRHLVLDLTGSTLVQVFTGGYILANHQNVTVCAFSRRMSWSGDTRCRNSGVHVRHSDLVMAFVVIYCALHFDLHIVSLCISFCWFNHLLYYCLLC